MDSGERAGPTVLIELRADRVQPAGRVRVDGGPQRDFRGWLELMREVDAAYGSPGERRDMTTEREKP